MNLAPSKYNIRNVVVDQIAKVTLQQRRGTSLLPHAVCVWTFCVVRDCGEPERIRMPILKIPVKHYLGIVSQSQQSDFKKRFRKRAEETDSARTSTVRRYQNKLIANYLLFY